MNYLGFQLSAFEAITLITVLFNPLFGIMNIIQTSVITSNIVLLVSSITYAAFDVLVIIYQADQ